MAQLQSLITQNRDERQLLGVQFLARQSHSSPSSPRAAAVGLAGPCPNLCSCREAGSTSRGLVKTGPGGTFTVCGKGEMLRPDQPELVCKRGRCALPVAQRTRAPTASDMVNAGPFSASPVYWNVINQNIVINRNIDLKPFASIFCSPSIHPLKAMGALLLASRA